MTSDPADEIAGWLCRLDARLRALDASGAADLFHDGGFWRDMLALTWTIRTEEGCAAIAAMLDRTLDRARPTGWAIDGPVSVTDDGAVEVWLTFRTCDGPGKAHLRLRDGRAVTLLTALAGLDAHPAALGANRPQGPEHGAIPGRRPWPEPAARFGPDNAPYVLIVGGGQAGLGLAARLRHLDVPSLIVEANPRVGDNWRNRYETLCLHDPVWYDHMPFLPFPPDWPVFTPKDRMGDWLELYACAMDSPVWTSTRCVAATRHGDRWRVTLDRDGETIALDPTHLVLATGMSGKPFVPGISGRSGFQGGQIHSSQWQSARGMAGRRAVVVGANTSAHDIAMDLWEQGAEVTMIQRSSTLIARSDTVREMLLGPLYSEEALARGIDTETADWTASTVPWRMVERRMKTLAPLMEARDRDLHDRLRAVGFRLDQGYDGTGIPMKSARQGGGFYIDVGCCDLIADGKIGLVSGVPISSVAPDGLVMEDGTRLRADLIVWATGFTSMSEFAADLISRDVADRVGPCWGLGSGTPKDPGPWVGELRNMWTPTAEDGLWFHGGNLAQARHYSRFLALQLKARQIGIPTPVYRGAVAEPAE